LPVRVLLAALAVGTAGLFSWVPPLAGGILAVDPRRRRRMWQALAFTAVLAVVGGVSLGATPQPEWEQTIADDLAVVALLGAMGIGAFAAFFIERQQPALKPSDLAGVEQVLARRAQRQQYQQLAAQDPALAVELGVGRPDRPRHADDGGLLDLNTLDVTALQQFGRLSEVEAQQVVVARQRLGRASSVDELVVHSDLDPRIADRLREYAVFLY
jgi:DNA uptake protein ComE-like DNA-binding protein